MPDLFAAVFLASLAVSVATYFPLFREDRYRKWDLRDRALAMGRLTPDRPKTRKPLFTPPGQGAPADACAQAKCGYCGRFGPLGSCEGCGAPNKPVQQPRPDGIISAPDAGFITPNEARRLCDLYLCNVPERRPDVVKR